MKLELKHLAPYLPYGLKALVRDSRFGIGDTFLDKITGIYEELVVFNDSPDWYFDSDENDTEIKLSLRPLSDLTKEINYGLSTYAFTDLFEIGDYDGCIFEFEHGNIKTIKALESIAKHNSYNDINYLPNAVVNMMYECHFDVFGLIEQNLAIDINTLNE